MTYSLNRSMARHENAPVEAGPDRDALRHAIRDEYATVALDPGRGFHFHTGRPLARILGYPDEWLDGIPECAIESFAGTGNPFSLAELRAGERVVDVGCGAGIDSLLAARMVGPEGIGSARIRRSILRWQAPVRLGAASAGMLERFLDEFDIQEIPFGEIHWREAVDAFRRFGKGRHPASLNFGDCLTYAAARLAGEPLLLPETTSHGRTSTRPDRMPLDGWLAAHARAAAIAS